jgi:hypothetical protein
VGILAKAWTTNVMIIGKQSCMANIERWSISIKSSGLHRDINTL